MGGKHAYLRPALIVSDVDLPLSFSSRLILVAAADNPMKRAKIGSATLPMMYVGAGMFGDARAFLGEKSLRYYA